MFNKAKKHARRVGLRPVKALFSVHIVSVTLPRSTLIVDQAILSACLERGGKISATENVTYDKPAYAREVVVEFNEKVELMATLYKDNKAGRYQEKQALLIIREQIKNKFGHDSYKGWGRYSLNLHELLNDLGYDRTRTKDMDVKLELLPGVNMKIIVTSSIVSSGKENDETMSVSSYMSDTSEMSTLAASFSHLGNSSKQNSANSTIHTSSLENTVEKDEEDQGGAGGGGGDDDGTHETATVAANTAQNASPRTFASYLSNPFGSNSSTTGFDYRSDKYAIPESPPFSPASAVSASAPAEREVRVSSEHGTDDNIFKGRFKEDGEGDKKRCEYSDGEDTGNDADRCSPVRFSSSAMHRSGEKSVNSPYSHPSSPQHLQSQAKAQQVHTSSTSSTSPTVQAPVSSVTTWQQQGFLYLLGGGSAGGGGADDVSPSAGAAGADLLETSSSGAEQSPRHLQGWNRLRHKHSEGDNQSRSGSSSGTGTGGSAGAEEGNHNSNSNHSASLTISSAAYVDCVSASPDRDSGSGKGFKKGFFSRVMKPLRQQKQGKQTQEEEEGGGRGGGLSSSYISPVDTTYQNSPTVPPQPNSAFSYSSSSASAAAASSAAASVSESSKEAFALYHKELQRRGEHIARLEQTIAEQASAATAQVTTLRAELVTMATALRREQIARATIADVTSRGDDLLAAALSEARDEAARACAECATTAEELRAVSAEKALLQEQVAQLRVQQAQEMELAQQAAAVAASAAVKRAEAEEEVQQIVDQLITVKIEHANLSMELEESRRANALLHRRLQSYAQQVAALEVKYAYSLQQQEPDQQLHREV